jgi:hypothetical protein
LQLVAEALVHLDEPVFVVHVKAAELRSGGSFLQVSAVDVDGAGARLRDTPGGVGFRV